VSREDGTNAEQIVAPAQQEVAARRRAAGEPAQAWRRLTLALAPMVLFLFFAAPGSLPHKLLVAMGGVCSLRPAHSYFVGEIQLPLEARMTGIYGGFLLTFAVLLLARRLSARQLGSSTVAGMLVVMFASMVADGLNSTLAEMNLPILYAPTNVLRLLTTGLLSSIVLATVLVWLLSSIGTHRSGGREQAVLRSIWELLALLGMNGVFGALVMDGRALLYYPIAFVSVGGVVAMMMGMLMLVILRMARLDGRVTQARQLVLPGTVAVLLTFAVLAGMAALRWTGTGSL
jgi:uncharacterized membrane protein